MHATESLDRFMLVCGTCRRRSPEAASPARAVSLARCLGWQVRGKVAVMPSSATCGFCLAKSVAATPPPTPPRSGEGRTPRATPPSLTG
jgi:hypothetical protein